MADVTDLIQYYANLLIIQYANCPKAIATIKLIADTVLADGIVQDIQNAYNIDTAVGVQLDVVGKYAGVDRFFPALDLINYFSLVPYSEVGSLPSSPPQWGFGTQATFNNYDYNGTLTYEDIVTSENRLSDDDFRTIIKLAILNNNSNYSAEQIDANLWSLFGTALRPESIGNMAITYFIAGAVSTLIQAIIFKELLPAPMGVLRQAVTNISGDMFAFTDYSGYESPYGFGFSTYADYATLPGMVLTYSQIEEV